MTRQLALPFPHAPSYAREDFLVAPENAAAHALIDAWPRWPAPLMLTVGPPGSGKTHLAAIFAAMHGAARLAGADLPACDPDAATCGTALVLDGADAVGAAEAALFHVLNFARARGVGVLATARRPPDLWGLTTPDLLSRLRLAPIVAIGAPEPPLVALVLTKLFSDRQLAVDASLIAYIASRIDRSLDAARAVVETLDSEALARGRKVTRAMAAEALQAIGDAEP